LELSEISFYLDSGESITVPLTFMADENTMPDLYSGKIFVEGGGKTKEILVAIEVESFISSSPPNGFLFDVVLTIPEEYKVINKGDRLVLETHIINLGDPIKEKVDISYTIKDSEDNIVLIKKDSVKVDGEIYLTIELSLPKLLQDGNYIAIVNVDYSGLKAISSEFFWIRKLEYVLLEFNYKDDKFEFTQGTLEAGWSPTISHDASKKYRFNLCSADGETLYTFLIDDPGDYFTDLYIQDNIEGGLIKFEPENFYIVAPEKRKSEKFQIFLENDLVECKSSNNVVLEGDTYNIGADTCRIR